jgi:lipopolysaccharide transport system ATP-binding protein
MKPILEIQSLSKKFKLHHEGGSYLSLRDKLSELARFKFSNNSDEDFWALKDVSFEVMPGESIGIIGKNGAGKSTLLKILSKITPPTEGKIISRGRIASLLEVGTGFHPELTGRENVYLNGSILGMKKREIDLRFDEIVAFAGTEQFLDTPLKHYSSGMQLRLAFAVAAFLEPEILVIDEVLAVGDSEFQKKCMGKMEDAAKSGRTILFVSHNMAAVQALCSKCLLLEHGKVRVYGSTDDVVNHYLAQATGTTDQNGHHVFSAPQKESYITKIEFLCDGRHSELLYMGCRFEVRVHFKSSVPLDYPMLGLILYDSFGAPLLCFNNKHYDGNLVQSPIREGVLSVTFPKLPIVAGIYGVDVYFANKFSDLDVKKNLANLRVDARPVGASGEMLPDKLNKFFVPDLIWKIEML